MAVLVPRTDSSTDDEAARSPHDMTSHTVVGMVLGILCLSGIILTYQLLPRRRKPVKTTGSFGVTTSTTPSPSFLQRIRTHCITLFHKLIPSHLTPGPVEPRKTRRGLRSLYLSPESRLGKSDRERTWEMSRMTPRLSITIPPMRNPFTSPHNPHTPRQKQYSPLDDDETIRRPRRPLAAILSPWSPNEQDYPYVDSGRIPLMRHYNSEPVTPPPIGPPPRIYVPETPLRGDFIAEGRNWDDWYDPLGDTKRDVETEALVQILRQQQKELHGKGVFVIGEEDDWDSDSDCGSLYSISGMAVTPK